MGEPRIAIAFASVAADRGGRTGTPAIGIASRPKELSLSQSLLSSETERPMSQPVNPANVAAAALVTQLFLSSIIGAGAFWVRRHERMDSQFYDTPSSAGRYSWMLLLFALATIALLIFSDEFSSIWQPLFGSVQFPLPRLSTCLMWVFLIDIVLITILVRQTHGSYKSPFAPVYFILPALAFFLREPPRHIVTYLLTIIAAFSLGLLYNDDDDKFDPPAGPYWFVSVACLLLSALVGYLTRPT